MTTPLSNEEQDAAEYLRSLNSELQSEIQPGEFTIVDFANANNLTRDKARGKLERGVKNKKLMKPPRRLINHNWAIVYKELPG